MLAPILSMTIAFAKAPEPSSGAPAVNLRVTGKGELCQIAANGKIFHLPQDEAALEGFLRSFAAEGAVADLTHVDENVAYKCIGHAIYLTQRAGLTMERIGFISEPAAASKP